jgi:AcrR family transcriptional regulator
MAGKGDRTKDYIVKTAAELFSQKGYTAVTMKDLCEACDLSRGGLYRHFGSTKDIFIEVLGRVFSSAEKRYRLLQKQNRNRNIRIFHESP